jgi:hypothetical protein
MVWTPSWYPVSVSSWYLKPSSEVAQATRVISVSGRRRRRRRRKKKKKKKKKKNS